MKFSTQRVSEEQSFDESMFRARTWKTTLMWTNMINDLWCFVSEQLAVDKQTQKCLSLKDFRRYVNNHFPWSIPWFVGLNLSL